MANAVERESEKGKRKGTGKGKEVSKWKGKCQQK